MIKEPLNVDFVTTGRQPDEADFARISEWIAADKKRRAKRIATSQKSLDSAVAKAVTFPKRRKKTNAQG